ncbi:MAG: hypothetical protein K6G30_02750 [Acetatifactor sp.]|nr:hypothetical protein [Acetatifactor sp.]
MMQDKERFLAACDKICGQEREKAGIGTLSEKTVHAVLKEYLEPREECQEQKVGSFYADIHNENGIMEIQTRSFRNLRKKLAYFLKIEKVTIVYPIPYTKWVWWLNEETGELTGGRKSPKKGTPYLILYELYQIMDFLQEPNLKLRLVFMDMEEIKLLNGCSYNKKRGAHRYDRIPKALVEEIEITGIKDYVKLIPESLLGEFTVKDFKKAAKLSDSAAAKGIYVLMKVGVIERIGKKGRAYLYQRKESITES